MPKRLESWLFGMVQVPGGMAKFMLKGHLVVSKVPGTLGPQETFGVTKAENLEDPRNPAGMLGPLRRSQTASNPPKKPEAGRL